MKKILYSFLVLYILLPMVAGAATFSFSPSTGSFAPGETFRVVVYVNPNVGEEITVAKLSSVFSANALEVVSFSQSAGWMSLPTPDSDLIDNTAGKLIKTGGFPSRVTTSKQFGVLTLKARNAGAASISVEGDSMMLDSSNLNKFVITTGARFTIVKPTPKPKPKPTPVPTKENTSSTQTGKDLLDIATTTVATTTVATTTEIKIATSTLQAQAGAASTDAGSKNSNIWYYLIGAIAILAGGLFVWRRKG